LQNPVQNTKGEEKIMLRFFKKDPAESLRNQYGRLVEKAFQVQHNGHMRLYSELTVEVEEVRSKLDAPKS
jgi:hypothetical protein